MTDRMSLSVHSVSLRRGDRWVLRNISLGFKAGERWALMGGNGAGKTQLLKLLATDLWPTPTGREARHYRVGSRPVDVIEAKQRIAFIGAELQDKYARYGWDLAVHDLLATGLHRTDLLQRPVTVEERRRVSALLEICGLTPLKNRQFLSLSYGQKRLALLARALIQDPDWLFLDEFYNGLDVNFRRRVDRILSRARRRGQSWIVSAHRAMDVPLGCEGLIELRAGRVHAVKLLPVAETSTRRSTRSINPGSTVQAPAPAHHRATVRIERGKPLLRLTGVDLYVDYRAVLRDVNWELRAGEHWAVFGANGAGKSSFLKMLYGDLSPALGGSIERRGFPVGTPIEAWKRQVGFVSPELQTDYGLNLTVFDVVASGRYASIGLSDAPTALDTRIAQRWLKFFGLVSVAQRRAFELSYGQLRRALFARAMASDARMLLLDEPLTGLDPRQRAAMQRLLERLMRNHVTLVIAAHHPEDLPRGMTHALHLHNGRIRTKDFHSAT